MKNKEVGIFDSMFTENSTRTTLIASIKHSSGNLFIFQIMWFIVITGCAMFFQIWTMTYRIMVKQYY